MISIEKKYPYATLWKEDYEDIVFACYSPNLIVTLEIAKELIENRLSFSENKPHYVIVDFTHIKSVNKDARELMNSEEGGLKGILGGAFLSNSIVTQVFINLYLKINKPCKPTKFFSNKYEALKWILELRSSNK